MEIKSEGNDNNQTPVDGAAESSSARLQSHTDTKGAVRLEIGGKQEIPSENELFPCKSCGSYHYMAEQCIYTLSWSAWLEYLSTHMPTQLDQVSIASELSTSMESLQERARELDERAVTYRPNYLSYTKLKADLMTPSSVDMFWDDQTWEEKLRPHSSYQQRTARLVANERGDLQSPTDEEDEEVDLQGLREAFGKHLPRTSTATLFRT